MTKEGKPTNTTPFLVSLVAGGCAGTSVDVALFPLDTIKTRLQSPSGFWKAGGFRGIYNGLGAAALGSAPGAALFFTTYESLKPMTSRYLEEYGNVTSPVWTHMISASFGEAAACLVRVPTEVIKQNMQIDSTKSFSSTVRWVLQQEGGVLGGLYRGYGITLFREVPFAFIQFPIYERLKVECASYKKLDECPPWMAAACGSFSGAIAAAVTTPLDVIKTRLMIGHDANGIAYKNAHDVYTRVCQEEGGTRTLFKGIQPRVMWISIGGFVFFGAYEFFKSLLLPTLSSPNHHQSTTINNRMEKQQLDTKL